MNKIKDIHVILVTNRKQIILLTIFGIFIFLCTILYVNYRPGFLRVKGVPQQLAELKTQMNDGFTRIFEYQKQKDIKDSLVQVRLNHVPANPLRIENMTKVSSHYGYRINPIDSTKEFHAATDYRAPKGTPVFAVAEGFIIMAKYNDGYGNQIKINHDWNGWESWYGHLDSIKVEVGQRVLQGELIGTVGRTGLATGPHLELREFFNGRDVNPEMTFNP